MNVVDLTLEALQRHGTEPLPGYERSLREACEAEPPPFGQAWYGERYRDYAVDPSWLANWLVANAHGEGWGAGQLWKLSGRVADPEVAEQVRRHAIDESNHSRYYISMLRLAFPGTAEEPEILDQLRALSPGYGVKDRPERSAPSNPRVLTDELIQMNLGEIRTRLHQLLLTPVIIEHTAPENRERLKTVLDTLVGDETRHIEYTARLIDRAYRDDADYVVATMKRRLADFNKLTIAEVGEPSLN
ncbi:MAG TPA: hypothetical protein VMF53_14815 [Alphaproteobacteria bacterium]|nr:hypothetical protein [Alphaproteobacteria bacterium]